MCYRSNAAQNIMDEEIRGFKEEVLQNDPVINQLDKQQGKTC